MKNVFQYQLTEIFNKYKGNVAVEYGSNRYTYDQLLRRCGAVSRYLLNRSIENGTFIGILADDRFEFLTAVIGVLNARCVLVALDPANPDERLRKMVSSTHLKMILIDRSSYRYYSTSDIIEQDAVEFIVIEDLIGEAGEGEAAYTLEPRCVPDDEVYIYFTSGSTGTPHAVLGKNKSLLHYIRWEIETFDIDEHYRVAQLAAPGFDAFLKEVFVTLLSGATLCIPANRETILSPGALADWLEQSNISLLHCIPSLFRRLNSPRLKGDRFPALKYILFSGEKIFPADIKKWYDKFDQRIRLVNLYGATESTILKTYYFINPADADKKTIPIGKAMKGARAMILDQDLKICNTGIVGEIYIRSPYLTFGYYDEPELTKERFIKNPFTDNPGDFLYKTGDLGRLLEDGNIELLGRKDRQVKIRGNRLELEEIEHALRRHPDIRDAAVLVDESITDEPRLVAYLVPVDEKLPVIHGLQRYRLPNNMAVTHINHREADYMYKEIFELQAYAKYGITFNDGSCIIDVGANIGLFTLFTAMVCEKPKIYAFEPNPFVFERLTANVSLYCPDETVTLFNFGLSAERKQQAFTFFEGFSLLSGLYADKESERELITTYMKNWRRDVPGDADELDPQSAELLEERLKSRTFEVQLDRLSAVLEKENIQAVDLLKINVEKAEMDVLQGITPGDWAKIRQIVLEVDTAANLDAIVPLLEHHGYDVFVDQDNLLAGTRVCYVYAVRPSKNRRLETDYVLHSLPVLDEAFLTDGQLRDFLSASLPAYMIPASFVQLERFPLTPNGKPDYQTLPSLAPQVVKERIAPRDMVEEKLAAIWADVLQVDKDTIGIDANFFELGGHSLNVMTMISTIHKELQAKIALIDVFNKPTLEEQAGLIRTAAKQAFISIHPAEEKEYYMLSSAQKRLYVHQQMNKGSIAYNMPRWIPLHRAVEKEKLESVFEKLIRRHEGLRTSLKTVGNRVVQVVENDVDFNVELYDLTARGGVSPDEMRTEIIGLYENFVRPFDLSQVPLLRAVFIHTGLEQNFLMFDMHHVVGDFVSGDILIRDFMAFYNGEELPVQRLHYKDYAEWQHKEKQGNTLKQQEEYWVKKLAAPLPVLNIPTDFSRPPVRSFEGGSYYSDLSGEDVGMLKQMAQSGNTTLYMTLLACYIIFLSKLSGQGEILVGTMIAGRRHPDLENIIGMFVNTIVLRCYPSGDKMFSKFLREVNDTALEAFENQEYQFEDLVERLSFKQDVSRNPLFDVGFNLLKTGEDDGNFQPEPTSYDDEPGMPDHQVAKFDMVLSVYAGERATCKMDYCTKLFKKETIEKYMNNFKEIVSSVLENRDIKLEDIDISLELSEIAGDVPQIDFEF